MFDVVVAFTVDPSAIETLLKRGWEGLEERAGSGGGTELMSLRDTLPGNDNRWMRWMDSSAPGGAKGPRAVAISATVWKRPATSFTRQRATTCSSPSGASG